MAPSLNSTISELIPHVAEVEMLPWVGEVTEMVGLLVASRGPVVRPAISVKSAPLPAVPSALM